MTEELRGASHDLSHTKEPPSEVHMTTESLKENPAVVVEQKNPTTLVGNTIRYTENEASLSKNRLRCVSPSSRLKHSSRSVKLPNNYRRQSNDFSATSQVSQLESSGEHSQKANQLASKGATTEIFAPSALKPKKNTLRVNLNSSTKDEQLVYPPESASPSQYLRPDEKSTGNSSSEYNKLEVFLDATALAAVTVNQFSKLHEDVDEKKKTKYSPKRFLLATSSNPTHENRTQKKKPRPRSLDRISEDEERQLEEQITLEEWFKEAKSTSVTFFGAKKQEFSAEKAADLDNNKDMQNPLGK